MKTTDIEGPNSHPLSTACFQRQIGLTLRQLNPPRCRVGLAFLLSVFALLVAPFTHAADNDNPQPVTLVADAPWIPLHPALDILPGSALDWSTLGFQDAPAGKHRRVIARDDESFAFADSPEIPQRFTIDVAGDRETGAWMLYAISR